MASEFVTERIVEFAETDMAGILHFSNYYRYMEACEHAFFRSLGLRVHTHDEDGAWGWARGHAECRFRRPLRYEDVVELHLFVREKNEKSIVYEVVFLEKASSARDENHARHGADDSDHDTTEVARGRMTVVCVAPTGESGRLRAMPMPENVDRLIEVSTRDARDHEAQM